MTSERSADQLKELAGRWRPPFEYQLREMIWNDQTTFDDLVDVIWRLAVLRHYAPTDPDERSARQTLGSKLAPFEQDDPRLYDRILGSTAAVRQAVERNWSVADGYTTRGIMMALHEVMADDKARKRLLPDARNGVLSLNEALADQARRQLESLGQTVPTVYPPDTTGTFHGIPVKVDRYSPLGCVWIEPTRRGDDFGPDHDALMKYRGKNFEGTELRYFSDHFVPDQGIA